MQYHNNLMNDKYHNKNNDLANASPTIYLKLKVNTKIALVHKLQAIIFL